MDHIAWGVKHVVCTHRTFYLWNGSQLNESESMETCHWVGASEVGSIPFCRSAHWWSLIRSEFRAKLPLNRPQRSSSMGRVEEVALAWTLGSKSLYHSLPLDLRFCISSAIIRVPETMSSCSLSWILSSSFSRSSSTPLMNGISSTYSIVIDVLGHPGAKRMALTHEYRRSHVHFWYNVVNHAPSLLNFSL